MCKILDKLNREYMPSSFNVYFFKRLMRRISSRDSVKMFYENLEGFKYKFQKELWKLDKGRKI